MVEAQFSITGANADHRLRMKPSEVGQFAMDLAAALGAVPGMYTMSAATSARKFIGAVVKDLKAAGAEALVVAGPRQPASVHALAAAINQSLGSTAVMYTKTDAPNHGVDELKALTTEMAGGQVSTLVILGGNPVYTRSSRSAIHGRASEGREHRCTWARKKTRPRMRPSGTCRRRIS